MLNVSKDNDIISIKTLLDYNKNSEEIIEISFKFCEEIENIILGNYKKVVNHE